MKLRQYKDELKEKHTVELEQDIKDLKQELFSLKFQVATGHLEDTSRLRTIKKNVARIKTVLKERELKSDREATSVAAG